MSRVLDGIIIPSVRSSRHFPYGLSLKPIQTRNRCYCNIAPPRVSAPSEFSSIFHLTLRLLNSYGRSHAP